MMLDDTRGPISLSPRRACVPARPSAALWLAATGLLIAGIVGGCATEDVGHTTTTTKRTTDTPTERTTVTETHEKDTTLTPR